jgi:hypothetical protein
LRIFENRILRRMFGPKREEVTECWKNLHNEELHNLYSLPDIITVIGSRQMGWERHVACMGELRSAHRILAGKPKGHRPLWRPKHT